MAFILVGLSSCGDDSAECDKNLAGTYVGTEFIGFSSAEDATVVIGGSDENYTADGASLDNLSLDQSGCTLSHERSALGIESERVEFTITDSTLMYERFLLGISTSTFTGVKQ